MSFPLSPARGGGAVARFAGCSAGDTVAAACAGLVSDLVAAGFSLPSVYLLNGRRLRCQAAHGYFQVVDGFAPGTGVIGSVVATGRSELVHDVSARPDFIAAVPGLVAEACSPVVAGGEVVGAVSVESRSPLPGHTLVLLDAAALALGRRIDELGGLPAPSSAQLLVDSSAVLTAETDVRGIEQRAVAAAVEISGMSSAAIVADRGGALVLTAATGPLAEQMSQWGGGELALLCSWARTGMSSHFPGGDDVTPSYAFIQAAGIRALSVHPLAVGGAATGWLVAADTEPVAESPDVVGVLEVLAAQSAAAVGMADVLQTRSEQAYRDPLTGLGNRAQLAALHCAAIEARQHTNGRVALLLLDIDDFKHVNDALGHVAGDALLVEVARRISDSLRDTDVACRVGGDEFAVVMPDASHGRAVAIGERLLAAVSRVALVDGAELEVTASIGIALGRAHEQTAEQQLKAADLAMYLAKERGKGRYALFEPQMQDAALQRLDMLSELRKAIRNDTLRLVYQPIVDLVSGAMTGVEALVRWDHPDRGPVSPGEFVALAEETGLILPLGEWVLREAFGQLQLWEAQGADARLKVSVNVSTRQLEGGQLLAVLDECLASGLAPSRLILEITETALTVDDVAARRTLQAIRDRGVHLAVDDFGTGYSSLAVLRSAPVSRIKIDRAFVSEIGGPNADVPIIDATIAMARGLGLGLVAEGVETSAQLAYLRNAGCAEAQGYLLARPMPAEDVLPLVRGSRPWAEVLQSIMPPNAAVRPELAQIIDLAVSRTVDLDELVRPLLAELEAMTGLEMAYLTRVDTALTEQRIERVRTPPGSPVTEGLVVPWPDTLCRRALTDGPRRTSDAQTTFADAAVAAELGLRSYIVEPVRAPSGELYGTLCAASSRSTSLHESDSATMRLFARLVTEKLRQLEADDVAASGSGEVAADRDTGAGAARRAPAARAWQDAYRCRRRDARAVVDARAADPAARANLDTLEATHAAFVAHTARLDRNPHPALPAFRRVVIADDDAVMRQLVGAFVGADSALHLAAEAATGAQALGVTVAEQPDILVLDYDLGDVTADDVVADVRAFAPGTQILLYSGRPDVSHIGQRLGVDRAVFKGDDVHRLVEALSALAS